MESEYQLILIFSSIGVLNGLLLSLYFLLYKSGKQNKLFGCLLLVLSIRIGKSVVFYFFRDATHLDSFIQIGLSACALIGPFLYLYIASYFNPKQKISTALHVMPWFLLLMIAGYAWPYFDFRPTWVCYIIPVIYLQWFIYIGLSLFITYKSWGDLDSKSNSPINKKTWISSVIFGIFAIWLSYASVGFTSYILGAVSFTFVLYILVFILFSGNRRDSILDPTLEKYGGRIFSESFAHNTIEKLKTALDKEALYARKDLKLVDVAQHIVVPKNELSQIINEQLDMNFSQYLNKVRVEKVKAQILHDNNFTLEALGEACGFKAKSTFYKSFKTETGMTPAQYKKQFGRKTSTK